MADRIATIAAEITGDPLTRGYSGMSDQQVADDMNTAYRPADGRATGMLEWLATHKNRTNEGGDTTASAILGRLKAVADAEIGEDPFRRGGEWVAGGSGTNEDFDLDATANTVTFGSAHDISTINVKDAIILYGTTQDDGFQQVVNRVGQVLTLPSITLDETLERVARMSAVKNSKVVTRTQKDAANAFLILLQSDASNIDFSGSDVDLFFTAMEDAGVWKSADTTALKNLSLNQISRGQELGVGKVRVGHVTAARA